MASKHSKGLYGNSDKEFMEVVIRENCLPCSIGVLLACAVVISPIDGILSSFLVPNSPFIKREQG